VQNKPLEVVATPIVEAPQPKEVAVVTEKRPPPPLCRPENLHDSDLRRLIQFALHGNPHVHYYDESLRELSKGT